MVWTPESFKILVKYDRPGECSPEKDLSAFNSSLKTHLFKLAFDV